MKRQYLHGSWLLKNDRVGTLPATVPGCIHTDLIENGVIRDLFWRDNPQSYLWVESCDWEYEYTFDAQISEDTVLVFEGLDTYSEVFLNGTLLGETDDMFIPHRFAISEHLKEKDNLLRVRFRSPVKEVEGLPLRKGAFTRERMNTRRLQCTYGWDWVDRFVTAGVFRDVYLEYANGIDVDNVYVYTETMDSFGAQIAVQMNFKHTEVGSLATVEILSPEGACVASTRFYADRPQFVRRFDIPSPALWYPNGYGAQPLYRLRISVGENVFEETFGIRTLRILQLTDKEGSEYHTKAKKLQSMEGGQKYDKNEIYSGFSVIVNGIRILCKGGNWVPCEPFPSAERDEKIRTLVQSAKEIGANFLRVWGGGLFEKKAFYEECDRCGILVAQDFLMACGEYPEKESWFIEALSRESEFAAIYLRNHPCLAWWHGDNENATRGSDTQTDYCGRDSALCGLLPQIYRLDPMRQILPSSPYGGETYASITRGTSHTSNFISMMFKHFEESDCSDYKEYLSGFLSRFISEEPTFGAVMRPSMLKLLTEDDLLRDETEEMLIYHAKTNPGLKKHLYEYVATLTKKVLGDFTDGEDRYFKYKYMQYEWVRVAFENVRRNLGYCNGLIFWMFNDCWPASLGWSLVDYYTKPKHAYYAFRRGAKPIIGSIDRQDGACRIYVSSDRGSSIPVRVIARLLKNGNVIDTHTLDVVSAEYGVTEAVLPWDCDGDSMILCDLSYEGGSDRCFYKRGNLPLIPADSLLELTKRGDGSVTLSAKGYVHCVELEGDATPSDNCFSLLAGETRTVSLSEATDAPLSIRAYTVSF